MSIARPAAEIEPHVWMFSSNWILPGPIRPSESRSIRTLREGSDLTPGFGMQYFPTISFASEADIASRSTKATQVFYGQTEPVTYSYEYGEFRSPGQSNAVSR